MRCLYPALALLAMFSLTSPPRQASAATSCTATDTILQFGIVDDSGKDATASVTINCSTVGLSLLATAAVRMCLNIGAGSAGNGMTTPRRMESGPGDSLQFQIYSDPAHSQIWGDSLIAATPDPVVRILEYPVPLLGGSGSTGPIYMYGRVPGQGGLAAGEYANAFTGTHTRIDYSYNERLILAAPVPPLCDSGPATGFGSISFPFTARATVADHCEITAATDLDFGNVPGLITDDRDQASTITLACTRRTAWNLGLDDGLNASAGTRRMRKGGSGDFVRYELYRDQARSQRWGTTVDVDTVAGSGTGHEQTVTVHGRVPAGQSVPAGQYSDVVTVTVTY